MNEEITRLIEHHAPHEGLTPTPFDGVQLFRMSSPQKRTPGVFTPSLCIIAQGSKKAYFDGRVHTYDAANYICATMPVPIEAEIEDATVEKPILGVWLEFDTRSITELLLDIRHGSKTQDDSEHAELTPGLFLDSWSPSFEDALLRLLRLLDQPDAARVLGLGRLRELFYSVVQGPAGGAILTSFGGSHGLSSVFDHIHRHLHESISIDDLASRAGMSRPVFDRTFRQTTTYSPLQFIKTLRLTNASTLIMQGASVGEAADKVGYANRSQFTREFRRQFGMSPRDWKLKARYNPYST